MENIIQYSKIFKIFSPYPEKDALRDGFTKDIDDKITEELNKEITLKDYENLNACFFNECIYIRDDGRKAKRVFNLLNTYYHMAIEEVSYDIIMENSYIKEDPKSQEPEDQSLYNMKIWRKFDEYPREMFRKFRLDLTSTDDVLDKIIDKGMDYLDDIDKYVLDKN